MAINVSQPFHRTSANPIDESMALTKAQMLTVNDNLMPAYYFTICQDDGEIYLYNKSATASAETGKFKKYAGGGSGDSIQVSSLPTAASSELGNIYQYIGADDVYKNGYFYKCIEENGVYSWKQHNTQPSDGGGGIVSPTIINKTLTAAGWNSNTKQQTVVLTGYNTDLGGVIGMPTSATTAQKAAYETAMVNVIAQNGASFTFECKNIPEIDLPVTLYAGGGSGGGSAEYPAGGTTGQALVKKSNADNDVEWGTINSIPDGGTIGQVLAKHSATDKDVEWKTIDADKTQYTTMPPATEDNLNQIIQYTGETTTTTPIYKNSKFYKCILDGSTYKWEQTNVDDYPEADLANVFASGFPTASVIGDTKIYAPFEHQVGLWYETNGSSYKYKPLYEKRVEITSPVSATNYPLNISGIDFVYVTQAIFINVENTVVQLNTGKSASGSLNADRVCISGGTNIYFNLSGSISFDKALVTIQYTKTTDDWINA